MASIGEQLRRARLDQKLEIADLAVQTKIGKRYLEAIERDDRESLPGGFFYKNWVQQYAKSLSLDAAAFSSAVDEIIANDKQPALPGQEDKRLPKEMRPAPLPGGNGSGGGHRVIYSVGMLAVVLVACSGFYAWWRNEQVNAAVAENKTEARQPAVSRPEPPSSSSAAQASPAPTSAELTPAQAQSEVADSSEVQIEVAATEQTWLSITPDGKQVFEGVLQPDEVRTVSAHETARIRVGNAGGLSVRLNGKPIGPIGPQGQIRTLIINRNGFHILEPKPAASSLPSEAGPLGDRAPVAAALNQ